MGKKLEKTNVMRILDEKKVVYTHSEYDNTILNAAQVAKAIGITPEMVFKTLVTQGKTKAYYVFMLPAEKELDLKKCAKVVGEKSIEMIPQKELLPLTGYIHGGCSPIGMKKQFATTIDVSAETLPMICFSGGRVGHQVQMTLESLNQVIQVKTGDITVRGDNE